MADHVGSCDSVHTAVLHCDALDDARRLAEQVAERFQCVELLTIKAGPTIGTHGGPGTLGAAFYADGFRNVGKLGEVWVPCAVLLCSGDHPVCGLASHSQSELYGSADGRQLPNVLLETVTGVGLDDPQGLHIDGDSIA